MNVIVDEKAIDAILDRGIIVNTLPTKDELRKVLLSGKKLRFYIGIDATATAIHLSHAKNFMLLEDFRKLGHEVIVLVGDFTAKIGDPSDEKSARKQLNDKEVKENVKAMVAQIKPFINFSGKNAAKLKFNSAWLKKLSFEQILDLASNFTVQHMLERDMFERRINEGSPVYLHEFLYPLMQGYDSVAMDVDVEVCGTDQTFNALAGRVLQKRLNSKDKFVVTVNLLENPKTGQLMSKSKGIGVFMNATANDMYGQVMAQPDEMLPLFYTNLTRIPIEEVRSMDFSNNPKELKMQFAHHLIALIFGTKKADEAQKMWIETFSQGKAPEGKKITIQITAPLVDILVKNGFVASRSEFRRLVEEGAIKMIAQTEEKKVVDPNVLIDDTTQLKIGKKKFLTITFQKKK